MRFLKRIMNGRDTYYVHEEEDGTKVVRDSNLNIIGDYEDIEAAREESKDR